MKWMLLRVLLFLALNFGALAIGAVFTDKGVASVWYQELNKAPWTPPGWMFGAAWSTIMICFSFYLARLWALLSEKKALIGLYAVQLLLNIGWNPSFFYFHSVGGGLLLISTLTVLIGYMLFAYRSVLKTWSLLLAPYFIWLLIATSLNAYILLNN